MSNTGQCFIGYPNTSNFVKKYLRCSSNFQLSSRCLDIPMKHCLSCLISYMYFKPCNAVCRTCTHKDRIQLCGICIITCVNAVLYHLSHEDPLNRSRLIIEFILNKGNVNSLCGWVCWFYLMPMALSSLL